MLYVRRIFGSSVRHYCQSWTSKSHSCGDISIQHVGHKVQLSGWIQHSRFDKFFMLRDRTGLIQLVFDQELTGAPLESCISIEGTVVARPPEMINPKLQTGAIEVQVNKVHEINEAKLQLPFYIKPHNTAKESMRLKHRYLDLRHPWLQDNLKVRSDLMLKMRQFLQTEGFLDIETPTLFRKTPGGAQEFVVPTHLEDHFYSLVQSPQQFKQLLMVGGLEKYYQIARCYRDEGSRPDRQPEFTQVDIELSFTSAEKVRALVETMLKEVWPNRLDSPSTFTVE